MTTSKAHQLACPPSSMSILVRHVLTFVGDHSLPFSQVSSSKQHWCRFCSAVQEVERNFSQCWSVESHLGNGLLAMTVPKTERRTIYQAYLVGQVVLVQKPCSAIDTCPQTQLHLCPKRPWWCQWSGAHDSPQLKGTLISPVGT